MKAHYFHIVAALTCVHCAIRSFLRAQRSEAQNNKFMQYDIG